MDDDSRGVDRRLLLRSLAATGLVGSLAGCGGNGADGGSEDTAPDSTEAETTVQSPTASDADTATPDPRNALEAVRVDDEGFRVRRVGEWEPTLLRGVNLGMGKPGRFPGETAITREEYDRWLAQMAAMDANVIRVYTVHPPAFYEALAAHNADTDRPLYLLHGNWLPARLIEGETTAYDDTVTTTFDDRLQTVVDVVNGDAELPERRGYAAGSYDTDVSAYTLGYVVGIEWEPRFVARTDERHEGGATDGRFVRATSDASGFERWLAERLDALTTYAADTYDHRRPVSFANWPTTDHLTHPAEPFVWEDEASVNPNHVVTTDAFAPGAFATYHVYPYYPDFMNFSERYTSHTTADGEQSSYAGYLTDLVDAVDHPVFVGEFGVPASRGTAHEHVFGLDQGHHTEREQGEMDAELFERLVATGTAGGAVFAWHDEWFKRTWNTMETTDPNRRPFWLNVQSPEQRFGLLSFDPEDAITLSGTDDEWTDATRVASGASGVQHPFGDGDDASRDLRELRASVDEAYLNLRATYEDLGEAVDWDATQTLLLLDTTPDRGNTTLPRGLDGETTRGVDFAVELGGPSASRLWVASHQDVFYYEYGERDEAIEAGPYAADPDNGVYHPVRLATSYALRIPNQDRTIPFRSVETGALRYGTADPDHPDYDSLADVFVDTDGNTVEVRLPWQALNVRDPSSRTVVGDVWEEGLSADRQIDDVGLAAVTYAPDADGAAVETSGSWNAVDVLPASSEGFGGFARFGWDTWNTPRYRERTKESYDVLAETYRRYADGR
ncbi:hypothetical protein RYH80_14855 [Halobaculum sp. MBLA0147]|uniref:hypothetical protein n=1 Tax=Halobaculum sp. MBLA0147 TaxID=3079934 RepID=UPI0035257992